MAKPYVYITRRIPEEALKELAEVAEIGMWPKAEEAVPRDILLKEARQASALVPMLTENVDASLLDEAKPLQIVANAAVGFDNIQLEAATKRSIMVTNTPDVLTDTTADLAFALLMATARRLVEAADYVKDGQWSNWSPMQMAGTDIHHKTIGIFGMGRIGEAVAQRAQGFGMKVLYHSRSAKPEAEQRFGAQYVSFQDLLSQSDFVVCLAPLTDDTKNIFNAQAFQQMHPTAMFINIARGGLVDEEALVGALEQEEIAGAGLDVFKEEPIAGTHPLLDFRNVVALPHIGSASVQTRMKMMNLACRNVAEVLQGKAPLTPVNKV